MNVQQLMEDNDTAALEKVPGSLKYGLAQAHVTEEAAAWLKVRDESVKACHHRTVDSTHATLSTGGVSSQP